MGKFQHKFGEGLAKLQETIGEGKTKLQGTIDEGKTQLQISQEIVKQKRIIKESQEKKNQKIMELGQLTLERMEEESFHKDDFQPLYVEIKDLDQVIHTAEKRIHDLRNTEEQKEAQEKKKDYVICGNCNGENTPDSKFCIKCGNRISAQ